jgi:RNA polymerase sigma-70 factor (ECF subfamily)
MRTTVIRPPRLGTVGATRTRRGHACGGRESTTFSDLQPTTQCHPFHTLLPQHAPVLRRRALKLTRNEHRADDLVQDTLLKAWAKRDSYRAETHLQAWLFTILRNTFFSDRRKARREVEDIDETLASKLAQAPSQDHALALGELVTAIGRLPQAQRRPILLMGAYGFSQLETAAACGCSIGTIKSRVGRGRAALNQMLGEGPAAADRYLPGVRRLARAGTSTAPCAMPARAREASTAMR